MSETLQKSTIYVTERSDFELRKSCSALSYDLISQWKTKWLNSNFGKYFDLVSLFVVLFGIDEKSYFYIMERTLLRYKYLVEVWLWTKVSNVFQNIVWTMLYRLADRLLLLKCYDNKMVKLPGYSSVGASPCSKPTKKLFLQVESFYVLQYSLLKFG